MLKRELEDLKQKGLFRTITDRQNLPGRFISIRCKKLINFSSNDYLGLAGNRTVIKRAMQAAKEYGAGSGASRLLAGGSILHARLEEETARFLGRNSAILFNSGYHANTGAIPALAKEGEIFSDELNHASIIDGSRLSRAKVNVYLHKNTKELEKLLKNASSDRKIIISESIFSMDGDKAPLKELFNLARKHKALLYVDEAHAMGVFGNGRGLIAEAGLPPAPFLVQMGTYSKAFGSYGGFIAGDKTLIDYLQNTARTFIFSTALPPVVIGASLAGLQLVNSGKMPIGKLWRNREMLFDGLKKLGIELGDSESPIIPVLFDSVGEVLKVSRKLFDKGFYAPPIRPPTVKQPRIRITASAFHTEEDISGLVLAFKQILKRT